MLKGLFGNVNQAEIDAEGAHHLSQCLRVKSIDQQVELLAFFEVVNRTQADVALAQGFNGGKDLVAGLRAENVAQKIAEQLDP